MENPFFGQDHEIEPRLKNIVSIGISVSKNQVIHGQNLKSHFSIKRKLEIPTTKLGTQGKVRSYHHSLQVLFGIFLEVGFDYKEPQIH